MNTLSIIIMSLQAALVTVRTVDGFIQDEKVSNILAEVASAIEYALKRLAPHQRAAQEAVRHGKPVPATAPKPEAQANGDSGEDACAEEEQDSGAQEEDAEDEELDS